MEVFNLSSGEHARELGQVDLQYHYFIWAKDDEIPDIGKAFDCVFPLEERSSRLEFNNYYESRDGYDFMNFVYFRLKAHQFEYEEFTLYIGENFLIFSVNELGKLHKPFLREILPKITSADIDQSFYLFLNSALMNMSEALYAYEDYITELETQILYKHRPYQIKYVVKIRNACLKNRKLMRIMMQIGDDFMLNDNHLIAGPKMKLFKKLDVRISRMQQSALGTFPYDGESADQ